MRESPLSTTSNGNCDKNATRPGAYSQAAGHLPAQVATAARAAGRNVFIVGLEGFADPTRAGGVAAPDHTDGGGRAHPFHVAGAWLPGPGADRAGAPPVPAGPAAGCRGRAHPGTRRPRRLRRRRRAAGRGDQGAGRGRVSRDRRARRAARAARPRRRADTRGSPTPRPWPTSRRGVAVVRALGRRRMSGRAAWCSRASCWRWRRWRAPTPCWPAPPACGATDPAACW